MLFPKRTKYRKMHRRDSYRKEHRVNILTHGEFGIKSLRSCRLTAKQLEATRKTMVKKMNQTNDTPEFIKELNNLTSKDNLFKKHPAGLLILASPQGITWLQYDPKGKEWLGKDLGTGLIFGGQFANILRQRLPPRDADNIMQNLLTISNEERIKKGEAAFMSDVGAADMLQKYQMGQLYKQRL